MGSPGQNINYYDPNFDLFTLTPQDYPTPNAAPVENHTAAPVQGMIPAQIAAPPQGNHAANNVANADSVAHMINLNNNNFPVAMYHTVNPQQVNGAQNLPVHAVLFIQHVATVPNAIPMQNQVIAQHVAPVQGVIPAQNAAPLPDDIAANNNIAYHPQHELPADHVTGHALIEVAQERGYRRRCGAIVVPRRAMLHFGRLIRARIPPALAGMPLNTARSDWDRVVNLLRKQGWLIVIGRTQVVLLLPEDENEDAEDSSEDENEDE